MHAARHPSCRTNHDVTFALRAARVALALLALAGTASAQTRGITETDLLKFVWVADPQVSPDGSQVAFVRVTVDEEKDQYDTAIWLAPADGSEPPRPITGGKRDTSPRWSPDGERLAFVRVVETDGRSQPPQIFVMSMTGGEARAVTDIARGAGSPVWSPDGSKIAFSSSAFASEVKDPGKPQDAAQVADEKTTGAERKSDVRVITRAVYRANGVADFGYVDPNRPTHVWTVEIPAAGPPAAPIQVTQGVFSEGNVQWSPDGARIYFVSTRVEEPYYQPNDSDLYSVAATGGEPTLVASIDGSIGAYAFSPDGTRVAFVGTLHGDPVRSYSQSDLWVMDLPSGRPRNITAAYDFDIDGGLGGDQRAPRGGAPSGPVWTADGRAVVIKVGEHGDANLKRIDVASGTVEPLTRGSQDIMMYTADACGRRVALVRSTPTVVGDLYVLDVATGAMKKLSGFNDPLFAQLAMNEPEEFWYSSFDGTKIQAWVLKPPAFDASKKYPLILEIHGGPHSAYGNTFTHEFQWMAAKGYVVLYTNPRGSSNYGQGFGNIIQFKYPGDDAKDILAGVDEVVKKGYVDPQRMGVTGGSGGGLLTNWIVTQDHRFKAAVSQRDIADWTNFWYTADFWLYTPTWFRKAPFQDPQDFAARSPITHVEKVQTPMMFILGDEDWRTPPSAGGEQMFRALRFLKKPAVMVRFPDEHHDLSRSGKPWHRVERLRHIVGWFDKYLLGKAIDTYQ